MKTILATSLFLAVCSLSVTAAHGGKPSLEPTGSLEPGVWGAIHQGLTVHENGFTFQSDCAVAQFQGAFVLDPDGNFDFHGELHSMMGTVVAPGFPQPEPTPVRYVGSVAGDQLAVTILTTDENAHIGTFILKSGQQPVLFLCQ